MKMNIIRNYLKLEIVMPIFTSLSIFLTPHISPSSYRDGISNYSSIGQLEKDAKEMNSMINYLEDKVVDIRKSRISSVMPRSLRYLDSLFAYSDEPEEIASIIHNESNWNPYEVSSAGACGLMMLMPHTAYEMGISPIYRLNDFIDNEDKYSSGEITIEERDNFRRIYSMELMELEDKSLDARFNPYNSMKAGIKYFEKNKYSNLIFSYATYNAGPKNVDNWIINGWRGNPEEIPYSETKKFVDRVNSTRRQIQEQFVFD